MSKFGEHPDDTLGEALEKQEDFERGALAREANLEGRLQALNAIQFWMDRGLEPTAAMYRVLADIKKELAE